jgi:hydroxymethylpyrimidine/phosphomethylpyrimidine kinase
VAELGTIAAMADAGEELRRLGARVVVVKGGHFLEGSEIEQRAPDVVVGPDGVVELDAGRVATRNDHGTGCSLSAACAAGLARGLSELGAIEAAKAFVHRGLEGAAGWHLGAGHGPIDHLGWGDGEVPLPSS